MHSDNPFFELQLTELQVGFGQFRVCLYRPPVLHNGGAVFAALCQVLCAREINAAVNDGPKLTGSLLAAR